MVPAVHGLHSLESWIPDSPLRGDPE